ncbi:MAG: DUF4157 domain-containing protein [Moorea sp. SIO2I5]|nr:DUF4157 domain-containing protein [Moorena sp. SIO2I5]
MQGKVPPWAVGEEKVVNAQTMGRHGLVQQHRKKGMPYAPRDGGKSGGETPVQRMEEEKKAENKTGLPDRLKEGIERMSGYDLSGVRVNYNSPKPAQLNAHAYTQGQKIEVAPGQERHLPHEAWHVVQQMQGRVRPTKQRLGEKLNDEVGLEREADVMGEKILKDKSAKNQRKKGDEENKPSTFLRDNQKESSERKNDSPEIEKGERENEKSVVQRVIRIGEENDYLEYTMRTEKKGLEVGVKIEEGLKRISAELDKDPKRQLAEAIDDRKIYWFEETKFEGNTFYDVIKIEAPETDVKGGERIIGDRTPRRVKKPKEGQVELEVKGLLSCIGVIIEEIGEDNREVRGAAGGHFVTPEMIKYEEEGGQYEITEPGIKFLELLIREAKQLGEGKKRYSIYYGEGPHREDTIKGIGYIVQALNAEGFTMHNKRDGYVKVIYLLTNKGDPDVKKEEGEEERY